MSSGVADTVVVIPTYDERDSLGPLLERVLAVRPPVDVLVVDDASPDGTGDLADELAAAEPRIRVLHRAGKEGLGPAYIAGFRAALERGHRVIVEMDADGSHLPEQLPRLVDAVAGGADLAIGARWIPGGRVENWPWRRRAISRIGTGYARLMLGSRLHDITSGYRAFRADALAGLDLDALSAQGYGFQVEVAWRLERGGADVREVPITFVERVHGRSKMTLRIVLEAFLRVTGWGLGRAVARRP